MSRHERTTIYEFRSVGEPPFLNSYSLLTLYSVRLSFGDFMASRSFTGWLEDTAFVWWHVSATLFFPPQHMLWQVCHNTLFFEPQHIIFFQKILCCGKCVTTHYFLSHNTLFFKRYCVVRHVRNTIFFEKITCCGSKNIVLWQTCHNTLFKKKYCVADMAHNTISFEK